MPETGASSGHGRRKTASNYLRPGLASRSPRDHSGRASRTPAVGRDRSFRTVVEIASLRRAPPAGPAERLPPGSELDERVSISMRLSPLRLL